MLRRVVLSLFSLVAVFPLLGDDSALDPAFRKVPFDDWFTTGGQASIKWDVRVSRPQLTSHQRLVAQIEVLVDGRELAKRLGEGREMLVFVEIDGAAERAYQNHVSLDLQKMKDTIRSQDVSLVMSLFVLPGDYRIRLAMYATATGEHSVKQEKMHVAALKSDPLPEMWHDLPAVEFIDPSEPPESWYLPSLKGRLHLPVTSKKPVRVEVLVNLTPSERLSGSSRAQNRSLGALIPALKTISQIDLRNGSMNIELLDLSRQRAAFHQEDLHGLDWPAMKDSLTDARPGVIDVKSLEHRKENAEFFVKEVGRIVERSAPQAACALIVLSGPVEFETGQDLQPAPLPPASACRVFYVRYRVLPRPVLPPLEIAAGQRLPPMIGSRGPLPAGPGRHVTVDQLESTIKPLAPRLFDVETPEGFRKALATMLTEISRM